MTTAIQETPSAMGADEYIENCVTLALREWITPPYSAADFTDAIKLLASELKYYPEQIGHAAREFYAGLIERLGIDQPHSIPGIISALEYWTKPNPISTEPLDHDPATSTFDLRGFDQIERQEAEWIFQGFLVKGMVTLISGDAGKGKSYAVADILARASTGKVMPCGTVNQPMKSLFFSREDSPEIVLKDRLVAAGADESKVFFSSFIDNEDGQPLSIADNVSLLVDAVNAHQIGMVVVDTYSAFAPSDTDSNSAMDVRRTLDACSRLAQLTGACVVVITHNRKNGAGDGKAADAVAGSNQMIAAVRVVAVLEDGLNPDERWFHSVKCNIGPTDDQGYLWRFVHSSETHSDGEPVKCPAIEWTRAGEVYKNAESDRRMKRAPVDPQAFEEALSAELADTAMRADTLTARIWKQLARANPKVRKTDVKAEVEMLFADCGPGYEVGDGPKGSRVIAKSGQLPETAEARAWRLAKPDMSVRELKELAGCRTETASAIIKELKCSPGPDNSQTAEKKMGNTGTP